MPPNFNPYSNYGYLALLKEATANTPVLPTQYLRFLNESLSAEYSHQDINEVAGDRERRRRSIESEINLAGDIEFLLEPKMFGHFVRALMGVPVTQTLSAGNAYRHTFSVSDTPKTYTFDIRVAGAPWVKRFYGSIINQISITREDNALKCAASITAAKAFTSGRITTAANTGTTVSLDQTSGLLVGDSILILQKENGFTTVQERIIDSITNETSLVVTVALDAQVDIDDLVVIKAATISNSDYNMDDPFAFLGGTQVYTGADIDNTAEECKEDIEIVLMNEVETRHCSGLERISRFPNNILTKGYMADGKMVKFYDSESYIDRARANSELGVRFLMQGEVPLHANTAVKARTYWGTGNGFSVEASTAGKAGNDLNVTIVIAGDDTLAASKAGNNILIQLANATASKNTGTLIAAAVDALTGVDSVAEGTGAEEFTQAVDNQNLGDTVSGATAAVVGRDASEKPYLQFDFAAAIVDNFSVNNAEDTIVTQDIPLKFYKDIDPSDPQRKNFSTKIRLVNNISSY